MGVTHGLVTGGRVVFPSGHVRDIVRDPWSRPFSARSPWNCGLGVATTYEGATGRTLTFRGAGASTINSTQSGGIWSVQKVRAATTDPLCDLTTTQDSVAHPGLFRVPASFSPDGTGDGWCTVGTPDGLIAFDAYRLKRLSATTFQALYYYSYSAQGDGLKDGTRASNIPVIAGFMEDEDIARVKAGGSIGHALALSVPDTVLKITPDATDGKLVAINGAGQGYIWPAHGADSSTVYGNPANAIAMGSCWAIPPGTDISSLGLDAYGLALYEALRDYGSFVLAATDDVVALYASPTADATVVAAMRAAWAQLLPLMCRVTGTNNPSSTTWANPTPTTAEWASAAVMGGYPKLVPPQPPFRP